VRAVVDGDERVAGWERAPAEEVKVGTTPIREGRFAENEAAYERINERVERFREQYRDRYAPDEQSFICERSRGECIERVVITLDEYANVRAHERWHLVAPTHDDPEFERVVARHDRYWIVEKFEDVG
jgi:hypothetical protein